MGKADVALCIDDTVQRHASQLEQVHFLPVRARHGVVGIRQPDKGDALIPPVLLEDWQCVRSNRQDFHLPVGKLFISIPQSRQLRAAVGSHKAAQEGNENRFPTNSG